MRYSKPSQFWETEFWNCSVEFIKTVFEWLVNLCPSISLRKSASVSPLLCSPRHFVTGKQRSSEHAEWTVMSYFPKQLMFLGLNNHLSPSTIRHTASLTWLKKLLVSSDSCEKFGHQSESERLWSKSMFEISTSKRSWISRPDSVHYKLHAVNRKVKRL